MANKSTSTTKKNPGAAKAASRNGSRAKSSAAAGKTKSSKSKPLAKAETKAPRASSPAAKASTAKGTSSKPASAASAAASAGGAGAKSKPKRHPITIVDKKQQAMKAAKVAKSGSGEGKAKSAAAADRELSAKLKKPRTVAEAASGVEADSKGYVFINGRRVRMISVKSAPPPKRSRSNGTTAAEAAAAAAAEQEAIKKIKTKLSKKELNEYRDLLLMKRRELVGDLHAMEDQALRSGGGNLSTMPMHMADIGTDTFDQDFMLGLAANERSQLREIDAALLRIQDGTYGVCQLTGKPIPKARLEAKPWAKYTIEAARQMESQYGTRQP